MNRIKAFINRELVFSVALLAAILSMVINPPTAERIMGLDWKTLFSLYMLLLVLEGFKKENMFLPLKKLTSRFGSIMGLSYFMVALVFFLAPFITNDVSLVTFVPLTIEIFRYANKEKYIVKIVVLQNIAAITGALLTPFGNPQNLFIFANTEVSATSFILHMTPMWVIGLVGLAVAIRLIFRKDPKERIYVHKEIEGELAPEGRGLRTFYLALLALILITIVTGRFTFVNIVIFVLVSLLIFDRKVFLKVDYLLLATFFCFFLFSSSIASAPGISTFLQSHVAGNEYWWGVGVSQIISNVPGAALLHPFTENMTALLYGVNAAGMGDLVGSLASLISFRLFTKEYPKEKGRFLLYFHGYSTVFLILFVLLIFPIRGWAL